MLKYKPEESIMNPKEYLQERQKATVINDQSQKPLFVKHILVPTDLGSDSKRAVDYAIAFARTTGARVTLLHVHSEDSGPDYVMGSKDYSTEDTYRANAETALRQWRAEYKGEGASIDTCYRVGIPWEEVGIAASELDADMIIISTHSDNWIEHLFSGSDAKRMTRLGPCPVLVVPDRD
jgi:nucleotide-binding universal stress UspA family protein